MNNSGKAMNTGLYPRFLTRMIRAALKDTPVVCLLGPRQCGKTTLVRTIKPDREYISLDEHNYFRLAESDPAGFLSALPDRVTIDEVQRVPVLLPEIKRAVDSDRRAGRFLLTGSANLLFLPQVTESLAGRMEVLRLYPLTEAEKERKQGNFLRSMLAGALKPEIASKSPKTTTPLVNRLVFGGYPVPMKRSPARARRWLRQYIQALIDRDIRDASGLSRLMEMLAFRSAELINLSDTARNIGLHRQTVEQYLAVLERLFLIRRLPAWHRNPSHRLIKSPKIHFIDSGLASALADFSTQDWFEQRERIGHILESFVVQQLIAQAEWTDQDIRFHHYRDKDKSEVDLVVTRGRKTWGVEVKAAKTVNPTDCRGIAKLAQQCGRDFQGGILFYDGEDTFPIGSANTLAVPLKKLWEL